jgi:hypothetical protein
MAENKPLYDSQVINYPPVRLVLGEMPSPAPAGLLKGGKDAKWISREMEGTVKRLIAHLKDEK